MAQIIPDINTLTIENMHTLFDAGYPRNLLSQFIQHVTENLIFPVDAQECAGHKPPHGNFFCADWWTIEVGKYMLIGDKNFRQEPPPMRLRRQGWNILDTCKYGPTKYKTILALDQLKDKANSLLIAEVGRGLEIVVALLVRQDWNRIVCYDVKDYSNLITMFFNRYYKGIKFITTNHVNFKSQYMNQELTEDTILILSHSRTNAEAAIETYDNPFIKHIIYDGEIIK